MIWRTKIERQKIRTIRRERLHRSRSSLLHDGFSTRSQFRPYPSRAEQRNTERQSLLSGSWSRHFSCETATCNTAMIELRNQKESRADLCFLGRATLRRKSRRDRNSEKTANVSLELTDFLSMNSSELPCFRCRWNFGNTEVQRK